MGYLLEKDKGEYMQITVNIDDSVLEERVIEQLCRDIVSRYFHVSSEILDTELPKRLVRQYKDFIAAYFNDNKSFIEESLRKCVATYMSSSASAKNGIIRKAIEKVFAEMEEGDNGQEDA